MKIEVKVEGRQGSEQPPSIAPSSAVAVTVLVANRDDIGASLRQIEHVAAELARRDAGDQPRLGGRQFGLAHQEQIDIIDRQRGIERRLDDVAGPRWANQPWRHDDGEIGFLLLIRRAAKQRGVSLFSRRQQRISILLCR